MPNRAPNVSGKLLRRNNTMKEKFMAALTIVALVVVASATYIAK